MSSNPTPINSQLIPDPTPGRAGPGVVNTLNNNIARTGLDFLKSPTLTKTLGGK